MTAMTESRRERATERNPNLEALFAKNTLMILVINFTILLLEFDALDELQDMPDTLPDLIRKAKAMAKRIEDRNTRERVHECLSQEEAALMLETLKGIIPLLPENNEIIPTYAATLSALVHHIKWWEHESLSGEVMDLFTLFGLAFTTSGKQH